jgi:hypothetical protein
MAGDRLIPSGDENKTKALSVYVTYDIEETGGSRNAVLSRVAKKVSIRGRVLSWKVGEFKIRGIKEVYGLNIRNRSNDDDSEKEKIVDTSKYAQNVQVFVGQLPASYQEVLLTSA